MSTVQQCQENQHDFQLDGRETSWLIPGKVLRFGYTCSRCGMSKEEDKNATTLTLDEVQKARMDGRNVGERKRH